jgi:hypothetical protein
MSNQEQQAANMLIKMGNLINQEQQKENTRKSEKK